MYRYDDFDTALVAQGVAQFRDQTRRYLAGELTEDEFRPLRHQNGFFVQKHAPMLRIAIPGGLLSSRQLRMLAQNDLHALGVRLRALGFATPTIGLLTDVDKNGEEWYQVSLGGAQGNGGSLGTVIGPSVGRVRTSPGPNRGPGARYHSG